MSWQNFKETNLLLEGAPQKSSPYNQGNLIVRYRHKSVMPSRVFLSEAKSNAPHVASIDITEDFIDLPKCKRSFIGTLGKKDDVEVGVWVPIGSKGEIAQVSLLAEKRKLDGTFLVKKSLKCDLEVD